MNAQRIEKRSSRTGFEPTLIRLLFLKRWPLNQISLCFTTNSFSISFFSPIFAGSISRKFIIFPPNFISNMESPARITYLYPLFTFFRLWVFVFKSRRIASQYFVKNTPLLIHQPNDIAVGSIRDPMKEKYFLRVPALPGLHLVSKMDGSNGSTI